MRLLSTLHLGAVTLAALAGSLTLTARVLPAQAVMVLRDTLRDDRNFSFYDRGPYRAGIPRPEAVLGYQLGELNTQYSDQERALLAIANAATDRVRVEQVTTSYERRPMRIYIVSSPENIARLDEIRRDLDAIADPRGRNAGELDAIAARTPAVTWISGSVHGNESPGFETAIQLLYQLAASEEPATLAALRNSIVIINPSSNPDGHERFSVWYNSVAVGDPNPSSQEHREPWSIQGRFNHYRFDMNRDLIASTQREVQGLMRAMLRWHPMVAADLHGHVATYFFPPAASPVNANITPESTRWMEAIGRGAGAAFDRYGWMYYSRDVFDLYYPGYYDTWPSLTGATGMTFETDGGGHRGVLWRRPDGTYVSFRDGIAKHYVASMATIEVTASNSRDRVRDYLRFRQRAIDEGRTGQMKRVVFEPGKDPVRTAELVSALLRAGVEVRRTTDAFTASAAHSYQPAGGRASRRFEAGAYVVDLAQPQGKVAKAILEPSHALDPNFARAQVEKFERNMRRGTGGEHEGYEFYDVTAWSLPVAFGVDAWWTEDAGAVRGDLLSLPAGAVTEPVLPLARDRSPLATGDLLPVSIASGIAGDARARVAYIYGPERTGSSRLTWHLLAQGVRVSVATEPIDAGGRRWPRGSYVVRVSRNDPELHGRVDRLAREAGVEVVAINSAFTSEGGQFGIGSESVVSLRTPSIAVLGDDGVSQTGYGAVWYALERRYGIPFTPIGHAYMSGGDLSQFTTIIIPSSFGIGSRLSGGTLDRLRSWVQSGGVLVTMGNSSAWAANPTTKLTSVRVVGSDADSAKAGSGTAAATDTAQKGVQSQSPRTATTPDRLAEELIPFRSPSARQDSPASVPGAHFDALVDRTHWLTYGYDQPRITVLVEGDAFYRPSREGTNVLTFPTSGAFHRSGFIWPGNTERLLRGTALLVDEPLGAGHVVMFGNEPMFRGWWRALDRMVLNAAVLGPSF